MGTVRSMYRSCNGTSVGKEEKVRPGYKRRFVGNLRPEETRTDLVTSADTRSEERDPRGRLGGTRNENLGGRF